MSLNTLIFGYYPYLAALVFVVGSIYRLRQDLRSWKDGTAEECHIGPLSPLSKLFHVGIFGLLAGHVLGMLIPLELYNWVGVSAQAKQLVAVISGGSFGVLSLVGLMYYLHRRLTDPEKRATGTRMDLFVLLFIGAELVLGLLTIPVSLAHADGSQMALFAEWAQRIVTFHGGAAEAIEGVSGIFKLHMLIGISFLILIPFSHLTHMWSVALRYILYPEQVKITR